MKLLSRVLATAILAICNVAYAGTSVLGFEIGASTYAQVSAELAKKMVVNSGGTNKFSKGPMIKTGGESYDIEGLNNVLYIFDDDMKLTGVVMEMDKMRFDAIFQILSGKYKVVSQLRPVVGDKVAIFKAVDSAIDMTAPQPSPQMTVRYLSNDLIKKFDVQTQGKDAAKKKSEAEKF